jgi:FAD-dependent urate hydroxylase
VWFVNLPHASPMSVAEARAVDPSDWLRSLREALKDDRSPGTALLARTTPDDLIVVGPVESMGTVPTWHKGRVVLVGDSVHAPSSSSGQGASLAIESAVQLGRCLRDLPHDEAFVAYERLRRPRVERIIANAARTNSDKAAGPVGRVIRDLVLPVAMKLMKPEKTAWQFDYRIDWDTPVTV